jgi:hypothetical protein
MAHTDTTYSRGRLLKFHHTKCAPSAAVILFVLFGAWGCLLQPLIGPGYSVDIEVSNKVAPERKDIDLIEEELRTKGFVRKTINTSGDRTCLVEFKSLSQSTDIPSRVDGISLLICFVAKEDTRSVRDLRVSIYNDLHGQAPGFKDEINRMAEVVHQQWGPLYGKENITVRKSRTGPPF